MRPNAVYERTRAGLTDLVPGRAARRLLDDALLSKSRTADAVSGTEMAKILIGPVYRGLVGVLPRDGLRREITILARAVSALDAPPPSSVDPSPQAEIAPAPEAAEVAEAETHPPIAPDVEDGEGTTAEIPLPIAAAVEDGEGTTAAPPPPPPPPSTAAPAPTPPVPAKVRAFPTDPDRVLLALAVLDGVDGIAVFDEAGRVVRMRGDVRDPEGLGRVIAAGGALLGRHGALRTVCVTTTHGVLVTVPVPPQWLAVTGASDMNLGAVYAALAALEEER